MHEFTRVPCPQRPINTNASVESGDQFKMDMFKHDIDVC